MADAGRIGWGRTNPALTAAKSSSAPSPGRADGGFGAVGVVRGSATPAAPFPRPPWWGEAGCRVAGTPGHRCLDVFGRPAAVDGNGPCQAELRAAMVDEFARYRGLSS